MEKTKVSGTVVSYFFRNCYYTEPLPAKLSEASVCPTARSTLCLTHQCGKQGYSGTRSGQATVVDRGKKTRMDGDEIRDNQGIYGAAAKFRGVGIEPTTKGL